MLGVSLGSLGCVNIGFYRVKEFYEGCCGFRTTVSKADVIQGS